MSSCFHLACSVLKFSFDIEMPSIRLDKPVQRHVSEIGVPSATVANFQSSKAVLDCFLGAKSLGMEKISAHRLSSLQDFGHDRCRQRSLLASRTDIQLSQSAGLDCEAMVELA